MISKVCGSCHESDSHGPDLLSVQNAEALLRDRELWSSVAMQLRNRTMPPADEEQPSEKDRMDASRWIDDFLRQSACDGGPFAGKVTVRRLNRYEYDNTLKDLLGVDLKFRESFPVDGSGGEGFDNNGETLFLPPILLERYLESAQQVLDNVIITPPMNRKIAGDRFLPKRAAKTKHLVRMIDPGEEISALVNVFTPGDYLVRTTIGPSMKSDSRLDLKIDGLVVRRFKANRNFGDASDSGRRQHETKVRLTRGLHAISICNTDDSSTVGVIDVRVRTYDLQLREIHKRLEQDYLPDQIPESLEDQRKFASEIARKTAGDLLEGDWTDDDRQRFSEIYDRFGPTEQRFPERMAIVMREMQKVLADGERRQRHDALFPRVIPALKAEQRDAARKLLRAFVPKAYRRNIYSSDIVPLMKLYDRAQRRGDPFEERIKLALKAVLVSPNFLFRMENRTVLQSEGPVKPLDHHAIASRLSYFLWGTMPDEELHNLARRKKLWDEKTLVSQVDRLLDDPKARNFAEYFVGQWLGTRDVGGRVLPSVEKFKGQYETELAIDFRTEAVELMHWLLTNDRNVLELLDADYVFVNDRLSEHYGLGKLKGSHFRKVPLKESERGGVLGLGGVHLLTSYPNRTSPVLRGAWVLETLLGVKVPNPPPDIPELKVNDKKTKKLTIRETLEMHRQDATCATCHDLIDPIGFGLDNYDVLGRWRDQQNGADIDAAGQMPTGEKFHGPQELKKILLSRKDDFVRQLCRKMLGYALGRSLEDGDSCTIEQLAQRLKDNDYRFRQLIHGIVVSTPFRNTQSGSE